MQNDWILDVLTDLEDFARANDLEWLAGELHRTREVAEVELSLRGHVFGWGGDQGAGSVGARSGNHPERPRS
jgi:hypothetical protein